MSHTKTFDCEGCRPYCYGGYHMREDADGDGDYVLAEDFNRVKKQRDELLSKVAAWEQKAANWMASPEAAQRLDGYRDIAQRLNVAEQQRDNLLAALKKYGCTCVTCSSGISAAIASVKGGA